MFTLVFVWYPFTNKHTINNNEYIRKPFKKQKYIDSVYSSVIEINSINEYTSFLKIRILDISTRRNGYFLFKNAHPAQI